MKKYTTYEITGVSDFLDIPEEKLADCLEDFHSWIERTLGAEAVMENAHGRPH